MAFNIVCDKIVKNRPYPAMAVHQARPLTPSWRQFVQHWPHTVPLDLYTYCESHHYQMHLFDLESAWPDQSWYAVALGWFDFDIDYFALLPATVKHAVLNQQLRILFFYHEGDNPHQIKSRLDQLVQLHHMPNGCYRFVSANTAAADLENFVYFPHHELLFAERNQHSQPLPVIVRPRRWNFTVLNRTHKWWRATIMADLQAHGVLANSYWSYGAVDTLQESRLDNPLEEDVLGIRSQVDNFVQHAPYFCDDMSTDQHNDHSVVSATGFQDSYIHLAIETHFDADQSQGTFITEKTFKPIKHGQPFVIAGPAGSVQELRRLGYQTFDSVIDHSYDKIKDNTQRWLTLRQEIVRLNCTNLEPLFAQCVDQCIYNQKLFVSNRSDRLQQLDYKINERN